MDFHTYLQIQTKTVQHQPPHDPKHCGQHPHSARNHLAKRIRRRANFCQHAPTTLDATVYHRVALLVRSAERTLAHVRADYGVVELSVLSCYIGVSIYTTLYIAQPYDTVF
jgi:hypothetical protein